MMETERLRLLDTFTDGEGEQTLAAAAVQALEQHRKLLVCSDAAAGMLLESRLENLSGAEKVFDFGAMSYCHVRRQDILPHHQRPRCRRLERQRIDL